MHIMDWSYSVHKWNMFERENAEKINLMMWSVVDQLSVIYESNAQTKWTPCYTTNVKNTINWTCNELTTSQYAPKQISSKGDRWN